MHGLNKIFNLKRRSNKIENNISHSHKDGKNNEETLQVHDL